MKIYIKPTLKVVSLMEQYCIMAASGDGVDDNGNYIDPSKPVIGGNAGTATSKRNSYDIWGLDDDDDR